MPAKKLNILIVDDDPADAKLATRALTKSTQTVEFKIETVQNLKDALQILSSSQFNLILLDLNLPDSRGLATVDKVHEACSEVPIVVLTGLSDEEAGIEAIKKGAVDYVTKPFKASGLRTRIGIALQIVELQDQLLSLAHTDELTGLLNRRHFFEMLDREILQAKIRGTDLSILMIDLDHFKSVNDTYGHIDGDMVLTQMGKILRENLYPLDIAARYGGEEFVVLMPDTSATRAVEAAERLRHIIEKWQWQIVKKKISMTASIGLVHVDARRLTDANDLIEKADTALYAAKQKGRNCVVQWRQISPDESIRRPESKGYREIQARVASLANQLRTQTIGMISALTTAIDLVIKDEYMAQHGKNVRLYATAIAQEMGLSEELKERIGTAALLQDLGKISIPAHILKKTEPLTEQEQRIIKQHPLAAARILEPIGIFELELRIIMHHHERFDGTGYPNGLKGREIPIGSRILTVADAFDSMTSEHEYRPAISSRNALAELIACAHTQFDPEVVEAFQNALGKHQDQWPLAAKVLNKASL